MPNEGRWAAMVDFWFRLDNLHSMFDHQFKRSGSGFVYRYKSKGEGYRITRNQRDQLCLTARRDIRKALLLPFAFAVLVSAPLLWLIGDLCENPSPLLIVSCVLLPLASLGGAAGYLIHCAWLRPLGELNREQAELPALTPQVARRQFYASRSYVMFAAMPLAMTALLFTRRDLDLWHGYGRFLWLMPLGGTLLAAWMAWSKWRIDQDN